MQVKNIFINKYLYVILGAVPGALVRWLINQELLVNVIGSFVLGFVIGLDCRNRVKLIFAVGFCGSLTTFSTWIINAIQLISQGDWIRSLLSIFCTLILGCFSFLLAFYLGKRTKCLNLASMDIK